MSCLSVIVTSTSRPLHPGVERLGGVEVIVTKNSNSLGCNVFDKLGSQHLKITCNTVCSVQNPDMM